MQKTAFISYSQKDLEFVKKLKSALEAQNIGITIDIEAAKFGDNLDEFMRTSVREADFTVSVVSENSLKSVWVIEESLRTLIHEDVEERKKFVPIYIDKKFLDDKFYLEIVDGIDKGITELKELTIQAIDRNLGTENFDKKRKRLVKLRNNLDTILARFNTYLVGDFSSDEKFAENLPRLVEVIKEHTQSPPELAKKDSIQSSASILSPRVSRSKLTPGERERFEKELKSLKEQHDLYSTKVNHLEKALAIETDPARKFQIEEQLKEPTAKRDEIAEKMRAIEEKLDL